jgi:site-specific recombinase
MTQQSISQILIHIQQQLEYPSTAVDEQILIDLVQQLRPENPRNVEETRSKFRCLLQALRQTPHSIVSLQQYLLCLITQYQQTKLYADIGILSLDGFWNQLGQRFMSHILPPINDHTQLQNLLEKVFFYPLIITGLNRLSLLNGEPYFNYLIKVKISSSKKICSNKMSLKQLMF